MNDTIGKSRSYMDETKSKKNYKQFQPTSLKNICTQLKQWTSNAVVTELSSQMRE
jgi:hypothetical protein